MSSFDVRVFAIRRRPGRRVFEVRWRVAGHDRSRCFITRALADSYHAELVRAAHRGQEFSPATGEPAAWATPEPVTVTWYRHAVAYAEMKWPRLAPHSRACLADAQATVTPLLTRETSRRPPTQTLRAAWYGHAFSHSIEYSSGTASSALPMRSWSPAASTPGREPPMGADYSSADTENGDHIDDPSEDGLFMLLSELNQAGNTFYLILSNR